VVPEHRVPERKLQCVRPVLVFGGVHDRRQMRRSRVQACGLQASSWANLVRTCGKLAGMTAEHSVDGGGATSGPEPRGASIRRQVPEDIGALVALSVRAWWPVHESMAEVLGPRINFLLYPDWAAAQSREVEAACRAPDVQVWVAEVGGEVAGFVSVVFHDGPVRGEIDMVAVDPGYQGHGLGTTLVRFAASQIAAAGVPLVEIGTGGDPGHAAARRVYEKAGFTALPLVRYYKALDVEPT
jgi:ribosomal protein S18 acetylase RimI-like enzyme